MNDEPVIEIWSPKDVARITGRSRRMIIAAMKSGELRYGRRNARVFLTDRAAVLDWIASLTRPTYTILHKSVK